jgi:hypothetical protein
VISKYSEEEERIGELAREMVANLTVHEGILAERDYCSAYERQPIAAYPHLRAWIERVDERPRV